MLFRSAFICALVLSGSLYLAACSCLSVYTPLEDIVCHADTSGGLVLELKMAARINDNQEARFNIVKVHVGSTNLREINLVGRTSCAWYMDDDDRPGDRFLYFTHPDWLDGNEGHLFTCALSSNIYRLNRQGTRIEYPVEVNGRNDRLAYKPLPSSLRGCSPYGINVNPLRNLSLTNNPGFGTFSLLDAASELPEITSIDVYTSGGQIVRHVEPERFGVVGEPNFPGLELRGMPTGIYFVVVRQGQYVKTLRYVKR